MSSNSIQELANEQDNNNDKIPHTPIISIEDEILLYNKLSCTSKLELINSFKENVKLHDALCLSTRELTITTDIFMKYIKKKESTTFFDKFTNVEILTIECGYLICSNDVGKLSKLKRLTVSTYDNKIDITNFKELEYLSYDNFNEPNIMNFNNLVEIHSKCSICLQILCDLPKLKILDLGRCPALSYIDNLNELQEITINSSTTLNVIKNLPNLNTLTINGSQNLVCVSDLNNLHTLNLALSTQLKKVENLPNLRILNIGTGSKISHITRLPNLEQLTISKISLSLIIKDLPKLNSIKIDGTSTYTQIKISLTDLPELTRLEYNIKYAPQLVNTPKLEYLDCLNYNEEYNIKTLTTLRMTSTVIHEISELPELKTLICNESYSLQKISNLNKLENITCRNCCNLKILENIPKLVNIKCIDCKRLRKLENVNIEKVHIDETTNNAKLISCKYKNLGPIKGYSKKYANETCTICQENYIKGCRIKILPCGHYYHQACIKEWYPKHTCPMCRIII